MQFTWQELIDRAMVYVDNDHDEDKGWMPAPKALQIGQVEYAQLYRRWVTAGLIVPEPLDETLTADPVEGVLAILGVAEVYGGDTVTGYRVLTSGQTYSNKPFRTPVDAPALEWEAFGGGDAVTVKIHPEDTNGVYVVRYLTRPEYATDPTDTVELPYGMDERLVLGMARRFHLKDSSNSQLLNGLIADADANLNFAAFGRAGQTGRQVDPRRSTPRNDFCTNPLSWRWF